MANQEHVERIHGGVPTWNQWREALPKLQPDLSFTDLNGVKLNGIMLNGVKLNGVKLSKADLSYARLFSANLSEADLSYANLKKASFAQSDLRKTNLTFANLRLANLTFANLSEANLSGATLNSANLMGANLSGANLSEANLGEANLSGANLSDTNLSGANLSGANIGYANLGYANLSGANFNGTITHNTQFGDQDFRTVKGLETIEHYGPSPLSINSLYLSEGDIPEVFVRGTGAPDIFLDYMRSLASQPIEYYTCFISYSNKDEEFAERLYTDLQSKGIRCWFALHSLKPGDYLRRSIDEAIHVYDKLILLLSEHSVQSSWVSFEVEAALEREHEDKPPILFPLRLDETVLNSQTSWAKHLKRSRHIGDFTFWKDYGAYQKGLRQLLHDLKQK